MVQPRQHNESNLDFHFILFFKKGKKQGFKGYH